MTTDADDAGDGGDAAAGADAPHDVAPIVGGVEAARAVAAQAIDVGKAGLGERGAAAGAGAGAAGEGVHRRWRRRLIEGDADHGRAAGEHEERVTNGHDVGARGAELRRCGEDGGGGAAGEVERAQAAGRVDEVERGGVAAAEAVEIGAAFAGDAGDGADHHRSEIERAQRGVAGDVKVPLLALAMNSTSEMGSKRASDAAPSALRQSPQLPAMVVTICVAGLNRLMVQ